MKSPYVIALATLIGFSAAHAGVYIETVTHDKSTGKDELTQRMQIQGGMARMESGTRNTVTIFKDETLFILDTAKKTYRAMDRATLQNTMSAMNDMMQKMQAQMAAMPPEQRAMMEKMMKQNGMSGAAGQAAVFDATPTGATDTVAGRPCKIWNITRDGAPSSQVCVVSYTGLPGKDEVQALAKKMGALLEKFPENLRGQYTDNLLQQGGVSSKLNGAPFITRTYRNGVLDAKETMIKTWKEQSVTATQFEIPADYIKQELPGMQRKQ